MRAAALYGLGAGIVVADQVVKMVVRDSVPVCNTGAALGIAIPRSALLLISGATIVLFLIWLAHHRAHHAMERIALTLMIAGGIGNFVDRAVHACVIDFIDFFGYWHFNIADASIALGAALFTWYALVFAPQDKRKVYDS